MFVRCVDAGARAPSVPPRSGGAGKIAPRARIDESRPRSRCEAGSPELQSHTEETEVTEELIANVAIPSVLPHLAAQMIEVHHEHPLFEELQIQRQVVG